MVVFFGVRLYGRTDRVPGAFFVATEFFHVMLVPLIPLGTSLVLEPMTKNGLDEQRWNGHGLPLSAKSVLLGWARGWAATFAVFSTAASIAVLAGPRDPESTSAAVVLSMGAWIGVLVLAFIGRHATFERARVLLERCQLPDSVAQTVRAVFKRPVVGSWPGRHPQGRSAASPVQPHEGRRAQP